MEQLFNDLQAQILTKMGDAVSLVDEDYGQLESGNNGETTYPVSFPCVLIGVPETEWSDLNAEVQQGKTTLTIRMAFDCNEDSHEQGEGALDAAGRMRMAEQLHRCLHGWLFKECATTMLRRASRQFSIPGGIKVYETQYRTTIVEKGEN